MLLSGMAAACLISSASAGTVTFGGHTSTEPNWLPNPPLSLTVEADGSHTYTLVQDGVTFDLNILGVTNLLGAPGNAGISVFGNGAGLGVTGGTSVSPNTRISNNNTGDTSDDEYAILTLSVSGAPLSSLSMANVHVRYTANTQVQFVDQGSTTFEYQGPGSGTQTDFTYGDLTGLTPLSLANVGTWSLAVGVIDDPSATTDVVSLGDVSFDYIVVPEPSTFAIFGMGLGAFALLRLRRR